MSEPKINNHALTPWQRGAFLAVLGLALGLRMFALDSVPNGLQLDEASIALNAYLVAETGRDEAGRAWPLYPQSSWNPKHPVYFYPSVASVKLLGLNKFAARLPAALFGVLGVLAAFLLGRELFRDANAGLAAALLLAVSPWHVHFSRFGIEAVALPAVFSLGLVLLVQGVRGRPARLIPGALLMGLTFFTYPVALLFTPLFLCGFAILYRNELLKCGVWAFAAATLMLALWLPGALGSFKSTKMDAYFQKQSITGQSAQEKIKQHLQSKNTPITRLIASRKTTRTAYAFKTNYLGYLSPGFLLTQGDTHAQTHGPQGRGVMLPISAVLLICGVVFLILKRDKEHLLLVLWILLFPVGASLMTWGEQHAIRSIVALPALQLAGAFGLVRLLELIRNKMGASRARLGALMAAVLICANAALYYHFYFTTYRVESAGPFSHSYEQAFDAMKEQGNRFAWRAVAYNPYMYTYVLFHNPPDPSQIMRDPRTHALDADATMRNAGYAICWTGACLDQLPRPCLFLAQDGAYKPGVYKSRASSGFLSIQEFKRFPVQESKNTAALYIIGNTGAIQPNAPTPQKQIF
jgi:4-amino-4-deoxy-L-arabinose transferase-like glycosyltransferase